MSRLASTYFLLFLLSLTSYALAGTTTLTTYYPPPAAAYNKVKLATNSTATPTNPLAAADSPQSFGFGSTQCVTNCCGTVSTGTIFADNTGTLYECLMTGPPSEAAIVSYCAITSTPGGPYINNGAIISDTNGTMHVCLNGNSTTYPQECINITCSYDPTAYPAFGTAALSTCPHQSSLPCIPSCPQGFSQLNPISSTPPACGYDYFQTSYQNMVISIVCCSGNNGPANTGSSPTTIFS